MTHSRSNAIAVILLAGLLGPAARAQASQTTPSARAQPAAPDSGVSTLQVFSRETVVDVTASDAKGKPVRDLKSSDFSVEEDGKAQSIRAFQEYSRDTPPSAAGSRPQLPPHVYTNLQPPAETSAVNILLLDALNTQPADQAFVKQEAIRYLKTMPAGTRMAVLGLSSRLRLLQGFTADPAILIAAVDSKKNRSLPSPFMDSDTGDSIESLLDVVDDGTAASLAEFEREQSTFQQDMRNRMTMEALKQIAAYVAGIKGRKNLIWFSAGMPLTIFPTQQANGATGGTNDLQGLTDYAKDIRKTTDLLASAQVALYPIDARGLFSNPGTSAAAPITGLSAKTAAQKGAKDAANQMNFLQKTAQEHLSMEAVAEATGGAAYYNTNDLGAAVAKAVENGSSYYSMSYVTPDAKYDGRYHSIRVTLNRSDVRLSYRHGYNSDDLARNESTSGLTLATSAPEPYGNNMVASMARGAPASSELLFDVRVERSAAAPKAGDAPMLGTLDPKLQGKHLVRYDVEYVLPARQLVFTASPGGLHNGSVEFDIAAYDVYGKRITGLSQTLALPLSADRYQRMVASQTPLRFFQQVDLPPGEIFLRVGVLDRTADRTGTVEIPLTVSKRGIPAGTATKSGS